VKYELVYFGNDGYPCKEESEDYAVYQVRDDLSEMRSYYEMSNGVPRKFEIAWWHRYLRLPNGMQRFISESELFTLCL